MNKDTLKLKTKILKLFSKQYEELKMRCREHYN